jgi:hypothetical protein
MAEPLPLILTDASLKISTDGTPAGLTELACVAQHLELNPDVTITTVDTFCGSTDYPGQVKWQLVATLAQSFDADATEEVLSAAVALDGPTAFEIMPYKSQPVSAANPKWTGQVIPQPYAPINGDAGDVSTVELEWSLVGAPAKSTSAAAKATGATAGSPGTFTPGGSSTPANLAAMSAAPAVTASPSGAWTTGQHVVMGDANKAYWNGTAWAAGQAS